MPLLVLALMAISISSLLFPHELGHVLGYSHNDSDSRIADLMDDELSAGERVMLAMPEEGMWELEVDESDSGSSLIEDGSFDELDEANEDLEYVEWEDTSTSPGNSGNGNGKGKKK